MNEQQNNNDKDQVTKWQKRYTTTIAASIAILVFIVMFGTAILLSTQKTSDADRAALSAFNEISATFINEFYAGSENNPTVTEVYGYDVSPDGDFYIKYNLCEQSSDQYVNCKNGKIYFWTDEEGQRAYGFDYSE